MDSFLNIEFEEHSQGEQFIYPVSFHCHSSCNLVVWRSETDPSTGKEEKKHVARLMDRLADLMHDYQQFSPLVALVDLQVKSQFWLQLMGDQDWHRGRFVLQAVKSFEGKSVEDAKNRWLGAPATSEYTPKRITTADFADSLTNAVEMAKPPRGVEPKMFTRYADILKNSITGGASASLAESWQEDLVKDINNLLGKPVLEET